MILTALHDLALREQLDPFYEPKEVHYLIRLGQDGSFLGIAEPLTDPPLDSRGRPKGKPRPPRRPIPRRSSRTVQDLAEFLVDKAEYVFGVPSAAARDKPELEERARRRQRLFRERIVTASEQLPENAALRAVSRFLTDDAASRRPELGAWLRDKAQDDAEALDAALFAFVYLPTGDTHCVHDLDDVRALFEETLVPAAAPRGQCLVTGVSGAALATLHAAPKGIPPVSVTKGGVPLTSVNKAAFCSYGLDDVGCAPISASASNRIDAALTRLLDPAFPGPDGSALPSRKIALAENTALVFWTRGEADLDFLARLDVADPEQVAEVLRSPQRGRLAVLEDPDAFYALVLSGTQGRGIVRSFVESTIEQVARSVERYFNDARVCRPFGERDGTYPLIDLRKALVFGGDLKRLPPDLAVQLFVAVLRGTNYPRLILDAAVRRNRVDLFPRLKGSDRPDQKPLAARCSLIKAYLVRNLKMEVPVSLDVTRPEPAYRMGRLLAVLDKLQGEALGGINATIVDRYYGSASSTPASVIPTLIRRAQHHLGKLRRETPGLAVVREKLLQEVMSGLRSFPSTLTLEHQGLFALGFYHQRQDFYVKKEGDAR